jgi:hypothetical protein
VPAAPTVDGALASRAHTAARAMSSMYAAAATGGGGKLSLGEAAARLRALAPAEAA